MERSKTHFPSLNRPRQILGMEPTLFMGLTLLELFLLVGFRLHWMALLLGLAFGAIGYPVLRRLTKQDPWLWTVYLEHVGKQGAYPARGHLGAPPYRPDRSVRYA